MLGDDLALNAQQVTGLKADRELPVVWAVAKGSLVNKAILVSAALAISARAPWAITPLMIVGGLFLCFEGAEKLAHRFLHSREADATGHEKLALAVANPTVDLVALEKDKFKGAIRNDFILSAEIIVITLGTVATAPLPTRIAVLTGIGLLMTAGVYRLVAGIVKLDDGGLALGRGILRYTPWLMKGLTIAGTAAMFLVGGGILTHGVHALLFDALAGLLAGALLLLAVTLIKKLRSSASGAG